MPMSKQEHTFKRFDQDLDHVQSLVLEMGGLVETQIRDAIAALHEEDLELARLVISRDHKVNALEVRVDEDLANLIALRQPMASDLRTVMALSKTVTDLERIGDEAERIARMTIHIYEASGGAPQTRLLRDIMVMAKLAGEMLRDSLDALARRDADKADLITRRDTDLDEQFGDGLRRLITFMMEDHRTIGHAIDIVFIIKALERIGDHAKNIAEYAIYMVKGTDVRHLSPEAKQEKIDEL